MFRSTLQKILATAVQAVASLARPVLNQVAARQSKDIPLERQRRALASTVDFVQRHLHEVPPVGCKYDLLSRAFQQADLSGDALICEFGVFRGSTINHLAKMTTKTIYGFDSFEGLPEAWNDRVQKGHFALNSLPAVRSNVTLIKGWFHETLPPFLKQTAGRIGFLHVDCDLYSSTKLIFELLAPRLQPGAVIVFDEYFNYPGWEEGEHKAFQEFLARSGMSFKPLGYHCKSEQLAVVLTGPSPPAVPNR